jgi:hypothetical protein
MTCFGQWKSSQRMAPATPDIEMFKEWQIEGTKCDTQTQHSHTLPTPRQTPVSGRVFVFWMHLVNLKSAISLPALLYTDVEHMDP